MKKSLVSTLALAAFAAGSLIGINLAPAATNAPKANPGDNTMAAAPGAPNTTATTPMDSSGTNAGATTGSDMNKKTMKSKTAKKSTTATTAGATKKPTKKKATTARAKNSTASKAQTANAPAGTRSANPPAQAAPFTPPGGGNTRVRPNPAVERPNPGNPPTTTTN
jgi:hypothetical protein